MKRFLALFMCVMLVCTTIVIPAVSVNADVSYEDYVPGEIPANLINSKTDTEPTMLQYFTQPPTNDAFTNYGKIGWNSWSQIVVTSQKDYDGTTKVGMAGSFLVGAYLHSKILADSAVTNDKSYVVDFYAKASKGKDSTVRDTKVNFLVTDYKGGGAFVYTKEYGSAGMDVSTDWKQFKGTIQLGSATSPNARTPILTMGLSADALAGTGVTISDGLKGDPGKVYLAEEVAYDITNTVVTNSTDIEKNAIVLKAEVVNQIGLPGYLNQEFTWIALDSKTRTQEIDGINIEVSEDTTTATVTADEEVANGFYDIVAYSEEYGMAKGYSVSVGEVTKYPDFVPSEDMPSNIMPDNNNANNFTGRWLAIYEAIYDSANGLMRYPIVANPGYWGDSSAWQVAGGDLTDQAANNTGIGNGNYTWEADTTYVLSVELRNAPGATVQESKFAFQPRATDSDSNISRPAIFFDIVGSEWQVYTATFHMDYAGDSATNMYYGYPNHSSLHNPQGTEIQLKLGTFYLAKEVASDINITADETQILEGGSIAFEAEIVNQLGLPYSGETNIEWMVMDSERLRPAAGFSVVELSDTSVAVYSEKGIVEGGNYQMVAVDDSLGIEGFCKGVEFTVIPYYNEDLGSMSVRGKLNTQDSEWSTDKVTTGLATKAIVEASLSAKDGDFKWYALDEDRISKVEGFTFDVVKEDNKETATVNLANTVLEGTYYIVAESADGLNLAGQKLVVDKSDDMLVIKDIITSGNKTDIETGLNTTFLGILELSDGFAAKADKAALASILASAAEEEEIEDAQDLTTLQKIVERLALVSMYNVPVEGVALTDEDGNFKYASQLKIADEDGVTINSVFASKATKEAKARVMAALTGESYAAWSEFAEDAKEAMLLYTLAYPNVNGIEYIGELLTEENLEAVGIDATAYLALEDIDAFNDNLASELYTIDELKDIIEGAEDEEEDDDDDRGSSGGSYGGGGGSFKVSDTKDDAQDETNNDSSIGTPETYSFADVPQSHWAYADIHYLKSIGVIDGVDVNTYAPNANVTREQFLKLIIEAFGIELKSTSKTFNDVDAGAWYAPYVAAGVENGIINGMDENNFGTGKPVTRQDACTILARALNLEDSTEGDLNFTDADSIASYARAAVSALSGYAVVNGMGDGSFAPNAVCTRAQAAKIVSSTIGIVNALNAADGR